MCVLYIFFENIEVQPKMKTFMLLALCRHIICGITVVHFTILFDVFQGIEPIWIELTGVLSKKSLKGSYGANTFFCVFGVLQVAYACIIHVKLQKLVSDQKMHFI